MDRRFRAALAVRAHPRGRRKAPLVLAAGPFEPVVAADRQKPVRQSAGATRPAALAGGRGLPINRLWAQHSIAWPAQL